MDLIITILPVVTKDLPISPRFTPYNFFYRDASSALTLTTSQPMVEFYLLTFPRFPLRKKEHKSYFGKNRTHDFRTSRCAAYLLDHSGDKVYMFCCCCCCCFLTLTDPLRIQPWSQDRRNQTKSNRESEMSMESIQRRTDKK